MLILVFDTETTALPKKYNFDICEKNWPHIMQLSYILYDIVNEEVLESLNEYILLEDSIFIDPKSVEIHKISREKCSKNGINILDALYKFNNVLKRSNIIVGHNLIFDKTILLVEAKRNKIKLNFNENIKEFCTMQNTINLCKIPFKNSQFSLNSDKYKYPKLEELIYFLFKENPKNLHNAWYDVLNTLRVYNKLVYNRNILKGINWNFKINKI